MKIHVIGSEDTVVGFGLIGAGGTVVTDPADARDLLTNLTNPKQYDLIIINSSLLKGLEDFIENYRLNYENPMIFDIPDETGASVPNSLEIFLKKAFAV